MKIEVQKGVIHWWWHLRANNGKIMWHGEGHPTKSKALRSAKRCNELLGTPVPIYVNGELFVG
jgi:hypothetical protein